MRAEEALSDKMRIVNCSAFRRLQNKAQVFSLARTGTVRTRLTHSIEVATYGQILADRIADGLLEKGRLASELRLPFIQTVENACLLHDIGNPPFGHMGEYAIREWFEKQARDLEVAWISNGKLNGDTVKVELDAFKHFDGNPQGFRIMTRLQWFDHEQGLNLTCSLLAAYCKYIGGKAVDRPFRRKLGFFPSEHDAVASVWKELDLRREGDGAPAQRHPLTFIMEAADDIAYCISDIEDALEKKVVTEDQFASFAERRGGRMRDLIERARKSAKEREAWLTANGVYHYFRVNLSSNLVDDAVKAYLEAEDAILAGEYTDSLLGHKDRRIPADMVKDFAGAYVYASREAVEMVVGGLQAVNGILDAYRPILLLATEEFARLQDKDDFRRHKDYPTQSQLFSLLPPRHMIAYRWQVGRQPELEPVHRARLVIDYLSGMTDTHALKIYNMINGTQLFGVE